MIRFLQFTVEKALAGASSTLKEYAIGLEVFDRDSSFDPRIDPIVRVEARRLRTKLKQYYETEGASDAILLDYPKGQYAPVFSQRIVQPLVARSAGTGRDSRRIAVLPFANFSSDPDNEYFSDGLTEELTHALTRVHGLCVIASSSASKFKGQGDIRAIGQQLNVGAVLEGSVRRSGDRLRITAQLVDISDGHYLWSETYERRMEDVFAIQDEISRAIVDTLRIQLAGSLVQPRDNLNAYNAYLKGRFHCSRRTEDGLTRGIEYFKQALIEEPEYALAYAGIADAYSLLSQYGVLAPAEVMPKALAAATKALALDDNLAEAHASMALARSIYLWEWDEAIKSYRRAIELNPGYATAHHWFGSDCLAALGRLEEAKEHLTLAQQLDPLSLITRCSLGSVYIAQREYDCAIDCFRRALDLEPRFYKGLMGLGRAHIAKGLYEEGITYFQEARALSGNILYVAGALGHAYALAGNREQAQRHLEELLRLSNNRYVPATSIAIIYLGLGRVETAMDWLERAYQEHAGPLIWLGVHPIYDPLREEARFRALVEKIGVSERPRGLTRRFAAEPHS
jgi:serine/threonine-protein kinase